eukprot:761206-Pyramimonas_sp.AAC.1
MEEVGAFPNQLRAIVTVQHRRLKFRAWERAHLRRYLARRAWKGVFAFASSTPCKLMGISLSGPRT